jgi:hypothetical protein
VEVQRAAQRRRFSIIAPREGQAFPREIPAGVSDGALAAGTEEKLVHKDGMIFDEASHILRGHDDDAFPIRGGRVAGPHGDDGRKELLLLLLLLLLQDGLQVVRLGRMLVSWWWRVE